MFNKCSIGYKNFIIGAPRQNFWVGQICGPRSTFYKGSIIYNLYATTQELGTNRNHCVVRVKFNGVIDSAHPSIEFLVTIK